jgi:hypothetical protein
MRTMRARTVASVVLVMACARQEEPPAVDQTPSRNLTVEEARVRELEQQARALARADGCDEASQCASAPLGAKACGGPRTYLVYCKATADEAALLRALDALKGAEEAYNKAAGIASDCAMALPPELRLEGRACRAATP